MMGLYRDRIAGIFSMRSELSSLQVTDADYTVFDTELTGLDMKKDSIISVGALRMKGGRIEMGSTFYWLTSPSGELDRRNVVVHGITPSELEGQPPVGDVLTQFIEYCGSSILVGHFAFIDVGFVNKALRQAGISVLANSVVDTGKIYEWMRSSEASFGRHYQGRPEEMDLFSLAREFDIEVSGGHNALSDAFITAQLFQRFLSRLPGLGVRSVKDLLRIGKA